jgi:hypothetical protein
MHVQDIYTLGVSLDVASLIGVIGQSDNQTKPFSLKSIWLLLWFLFNTGFTIIMLKYILSYYISQLLKFTSYGGQFCPASDNHELP